MHDLRVASQEPCVSDERMCTCLRVNGLEASASTPRRARSGTAPRWARPAPIITPIDAFVRAMIRRRTSTTSLLCWVDGAHGALAVQGTCQRCRWICRSSTGSIFWEDDHALAIRGTPVRMLSARSKRDVGHPSLRGASARDGEEKEPFLLANRPCVPRMCQPLLAEKPMKLKRCQWKDPTRAGTPCDAMAPCVDGRALCREHKLRVENAAVRVACTLSLLMPISGVRPYNRNEPAAKSK